MSKPIFKASSRMKNSITMPPSLNFTGILLSLCTLIISITTNAQPQFPIFHCSNITYTPNSTFPANLNTLFSALSSSNAARPNGFYNFTAGRQPPDVAYGLFLCRGDLAADSCQDCVARATKEVVKVCPDSKVVTIWYDECMLRYSNESIFSIRDKDELFMNNINNVTGPNLFSVVLGELLSDIINRASTSQSGKKFATRETYYSLSVQTLYGLAQCTPDLTVSDCNWCLQSGKSGFPDCCNGKQGAIFFSPSCILRYEMYPFYSLNATAANPTPASPVLPPPPTTQRKKGISWRVLTGIIVPIVISVLLFITGFYFLCGKASKKSDGIKQDSVVDEIATGESLQYSLATIQAATNNFSDDNKIGAGGFGPVYKGVLTNGTEIAVKRLSQNSGQGAEEFKNEIALVVKLQHRNLVRMLGFSLQEEEKILIYEYVPNKSLDYLLFDPRQREKLDWSRRYKIIGGIARGMLYLHEDSRLRIIHRDLKASNILLDNDMNAKISDFGMARIFGVDQSQGNTSKVVGTYGYMSPEYVINGQFSVKSDIYSFGVLILEIVSGKKNSGFYQSNSSDYLLNYAWKLWRDENPLELMDPTLEGSYSRNEVTKCIHIGLLSVQDDPDRRPNMAQVVLMLSNDSINTSVPQQPTFFARIRNNVANAPREHETDTSTSKSTWSVNDASISEIGPR